MWNETDEVLRIIDIIENHQTLGAINFQYSINLCCKMLDKMLCRGEIYEEK